MSADNIVLRARGLRTAYPIRSGLLRRETDSLVAVDDVDLEIRAGETLGLVGESGSGKSTLARTLIGLERPASGTIEFQGENLLAMSNEERRRISGDLQLVFQDPGSSLNPRRTAFEIVSEGWLIRPSDAPKRSLWRGRVEELLERVGLSPNHLDRYPHQFSGGQRQRISIARALAMRPKLIICDEPVSALDVSVQAQVLNLLVDLQRDFDLTYLFISHDLSVVRYISDRIAVMYKGRIIESGPSEDIFRAPEQEYTQKLLSSIPCIRPWADSSVSGASLRKEA